MKTARAAPSAAASILPGLAGAIFMLGALMVGGTDWTWQAAPALVVPVALILVGAGLILFSLRDLRAAFIASRARTEIQATVLEVRRDLDVNRMSQTTHWSVVARGVWPDGQPCEFYSRRIRKDPRDQILPGQSVTVRADPASRIYWVDLATVAGPAMRPAAMRPRGPDATVVQTRGRPVRGMLIGGGMALLGLVIIGLAQGRGAFPSMGLALAGFGLLVSALSYAAYRSARRLEADGVTFTVRITKITHTVMAGRHPPDRWDIVAEGAWPDGLTQTFRGQGLTALGDLKEGSAVQARGDPRTRTYELNLDGAPR